MKSTLIWIICVSLGAAAGYALSMVFAYNLYLLLLLGVIIGSSAGITWNIHRDRMEDLNEITSFEELDSKNEESDSLNTDNAESESIS